MLVWRLQAEVVAELRQSIQSIAVGAGSSLRGDQAAGLRRLFGRTQSRVVSFSAGSAGVGKSLLIANLAATLAREGKEVLVFDEHPKDNVASCFGALARSDLLQVINGERKLEDILLNVAPGLRILPAAKAVKKLSKLTAQQQDNFVDSVRYMERPADVVLVDASLDHPLDFSPLGLVAHDTVIVLSPTSASITDAYALIKKVSLAYTRKEFKILVNKVRNAEEAEAIYRNIAQLTQQRGLARLEYAGYAPLDEQLRQAACLCQPVINLFSDSSAAKAYRVLAKELLNWPTLSDDAGGLEQFVKQLLHLSQSIDPIPIYA